MPTEDEWYKAAYLMPDGSGYSQFANGKDTIPAADEGWNYLGGAYNEPWNVGTGTQEQNGTFDMMGNVYEWNETLSGVINRGRRGGAYLFSSGLRSNARVNGPDSEGAAVGFRVTEIVPTPSAVLLGTLGLAVAGYRLRKRKTA